MSSVIGFLFKSVLSAAFGLLFLVGVVFLVGQVGMGDYVERSFYVDVSEAELTAGIFGVVLGLMLAVFAVIAAVLALLGLRVTLKSFVRILVWVMTVNIVLAACVLMSVAGFISSDGQDFLVASGWVVLGVLGVWIGGIVAYYLLGWLAFFLGISFEQLGDAQPRGRGMLFSEALESGYSKPQIRAFIDELSREGQRGNAGMVYTTLILYGIPFFAILAAVMLVF